MRKNIILWQNNHVDIINTGFIAKDHTNDLKTKLKNIEEYIDNIYDDISERSNIIMVIHSSDYIEYSEILEASRSLRGISKYEDDIFILSGSIKAFKDIFSNLKDNENDIARSILNTLYGVPKAYFKEFISAGIMEESKFIDEDIVYDSLHPMNTIIVNKEYTIVDIDPIEKIKEEFLSKSIELNVDDLLDICSVTIKHDTDITIYTYRELLELCKRNITLYGEHSPEDIDLFYKFKDSSEVLQGDTFRFLIPKYMIVQGTPDDMLTEELSQEEQILFNQ